MSQSPNTVDVIDIPEHCGNAPRKAVVRDFLIALYQRDEPAVLDRLRDDVQWDVIGSTQLHGHQAVESWLKTQPDVSALHLLTIITYGTDCAADGRVVGDDGTQTAFSHVFSFAGHTKTAQLKTVRSYLVWLNTPTAR